MSRVVFTANLSRHLPAPELRVPGATLAEVLDAVFAVQPALRGYVVDDQGHVHPADALHVATRKDLFVFERGAHGYSQTAVHFLGDPVTITLDDPRDCAIYAALNLGHFGVKLRRPEDGGRTFETLNRGLPAHGYDLIYRHGLDIDATGRVWAMGSTTGSLWITEDGGDLWVAISEHLPPIYSVRFAG